MVRDPRTPDQINGTTTISMTAQTAQAALLPNGVADTVPPAAAREWRIVTALVDHYAGYGYELVKPPLMEFEESLLSGTGAACAPHMFRLMDPVSQRMLGLRSDITPQIARISQTRLHKRARPLRLSYVGDVVRITGTQLRPERAFRQIGAELFGSLHPAADAEIIELAISAALKLGIRNVSIDLCLPTLLPAMLASQPLDAEIRTAIENAVYRHDTDQLPDHPIAGSIAGLLNAAGKASHVLSAMDGLGLPDRLDADRNRLRHVVEHLQTCFDDLLITVDLLERRGFEYQSGLSFTLFAKGIRGELGRGGRYRTATTGANMVQAPLPGANGSAVGEPAVGFTLFADTLLRAVPEFEADRRLYLPRSHRAEAARLRADGWVVICALTDETEGGGIEPAARAQHCTHYWQDGGAVPLPREGE